MHNVLLHANIQTQTLTYAYLYITSQNDNFNSMVEDKLLSEFPPWRGGKKKPREHQTQHHTFSYKFMPLNYDVK